MANEISVDGKTTKQEKNLLESLNRLNELTGKQISVKHRFLLGMVQGVGTAIGATILAGILFAFLAWSITTAESVPWLNNLVNQIDWEQLSIRNDGEDLNNLPQSTEENSTARDNQELIRSLDELNNTLEGWSDSKSTDELKDDTTKVNETEEEAEETI